MMSSLASYLAQHQFCVLVEYLRSTCDDHAFQSTLAGYPTVMTFADRVQTDHDLAPLDMSLNYPKTHEKVLHFSGKARDISDFKVFLEQAKQHNIRNLLLLTGDKLKAHRDGKQGTPRTRYLESVNAVMAAKEHGGFHIGVAFNPFKYAEAERDAQYLKLCKKFKAGADFVITQLGYDIKALKQAQAFLKANHHAQKMLACVMPLHFARANFMLKNNVAGIVITPQMLQVLAQEKQQGMRENAYKRCAVQILWCQHVGFAGVHLSACHQAKEQALLEHYLLQYQHFTRDQLEALWYELWQTKTNDIFVPKLTCYSHQPSSTQLIRYQQLHFMHVSLFETTIAKHIGQFIFKAKFWNKHFASMLLMKSEAMTKHGLVGCESCGQCRLGDTLYICPETCPKGLANGPCGGTHLDRCEFGDRECIHSVKARLAKAVNKTEILKENLIETVAIETRGRSSWQHWFLKPTQ